MEFLANLLSMVSVASSNDKCLWLTWDEPECPKDLL